MTAREQHELEIQRLYNGALENVLKRVTGKFPELTYVGKGYTLQAMTDDLWRIIREGKA